MGGFTVWQGLGIVAGAIIGFYTGGAGWAMAGSIIMGASVGYSVGTMIDPQAPDMPQAGEPQMGELDVPTAEEGLTIPDILGTQRVAGNMFWYDGARSKEVKEKQEGGGKGGGGGSSKVTVGYKYYLTWQVGLCLGPVDALLAVFRNEEPVWEGELEDDGSGMQTITLEGMGSCDFYFGGTSQPRPTQTIAYIGTTYNPPYNGLCYALMDDLFIGEYNRAPSMRFLIRKTPAFSWSEKERIGTYDYNPIHACYYVLNQLAGLPTTWFDETIIASSASEIASINEGHGVSILFSAQRPAQQYLETILSHIGGLMRYTNESKFAFELLRATTAATSLLELTDDDYVEEPMITRKTWLDVVSEVRVQHHIRYDVELGTEQPGTPDIYSFAYCDEAVSHDPSGTPERGYTVSKTVFTSNQNWLDDYAIATADPKPGQLDGGRWFGALLHVGDSSGFQNGEQNIAYPTDYTTPQIDSECGIDYARVAYSSPTNQVAIDQFNVWTNNGADYRPGSYFVFSRDITTSNDATQLANGAADIAAMKQYLIDEGLDHIVYQHEEDLTDERWLDWIVKNVTGN